MAADNKVWYDEKEHIFIVTLSRRVDERTVADVSAALRNCVRPNLKKGKAIKFLIDLRMVEWDSETTHYKARAICQAHLQEFRGHDYFSAILNNVYEGRPSSKESFFKQERDALDWLREINCLR